ASNQLLPNATRSGGSPCPPVVRGESDHGRARGPAPTITEHVSAETSVEEAAPTFSQKRADALVAMADLAMTSVAADGRPACSADEYQVMVHIHAGAGRNVSAETSFPPPRSAPCTLACDE